MSDRLAACAAARVRLAPETISGRYPTWRRREVIVRKISQHQSEQVERLLYPSIGLFIDGKWIYDREPWTEVRNPSTENVLGEVPKATDNDLADVLSAAQKGFHMWRDTAPSERAGVILRAVANLRDRSSDIAKILTLEMPKRRSTAAEIFSLGTQLRASEASA
jgi:succinate-semialdehyde dehydrogenase / glutarate-semialdehyde dehydrogenase